MNTYLPVNYDIEYEDTNHVLYERQNYRVNVVYDVKTKYRVRLISSQLKEMGKEGEQ